MFGFCEARGMFGYTSRTVSYAEELASVSICYSRKGGFNTPLSRLLHCTMHAESVLFCVSVLGCVLGVLSCPTSGDVNKDYVCTLLTPPGINHPPHPDHLAHAPSSRVNQHPC